MSYVPPARFTDPVLPGSLIRLSLSDFKLIPRLKASIYASGDLQYTTGISGNWIYCSISNIVSSQASDLRNNRSTYGPLKDPSDMKYIHGNPTP